MAAERGRGRRPQEPDGHDDPAAPETGGWVDERTTLSPAEIHARHVRQRLEGGAAPTPDAYRRAVEQWRRLPGAAAISPADLGGPPVPPDHDDPDHDDEPREDPR